MSPEFVDNLSAKFVERPTSCNGKNTFKNSSICNVTNIITKI